MTGRSLPLIAEFKRLKELDLSRLPLADGDLAHLAGLKELASLYLTGTPLTDSCLPHLRGLKQLELLDTQGTQITPEGLKRLRSSLPKLKRPCSFGRCQIALARPATAFYHPARDECSAMLVLTRHMRSEPISSRIGRRMLA